MNRVVTASAASPQEEALERALRPKGLAEYVGQARCASSWKSSSARPDDVLFIDEIHQLSPVVEQILYPALEDYQIGIMIGAAARHRHLAARGACDSAGQAGTGGADTPQGDEWLGLVRAFQVAGAARVVASQWPVDDAVARRFMAGFHQALAAGAVPTQAKAAVRAEHPHPFHWAAFALYGGW